MPRSSASGRTSATNRVRAQNIPASLSFNGTTSKIVATAISGLSTGFTFATWVKPNNITAVQTMLANATGASDEAVLGFDVNGNVRMGYFDGTTTHKTSSNNPTNIIQGQWHFIVGGYDGTNTFLYVDTVVQSGGNAPSFASTNTLIIGARNDSSRFLLGNLLQVLIYKRVLTQDQINKLYQQGKVPDTPFAQYNLTEGADTTAIDTSGNGNNGTITAGTYTTDVPSALRKQVGGKLAYNGDFEYAPPFTAAQTNTGWVTGVSGGGGSTSTSSSPFGWGCITAFGTGTVQYDNTTPNTGNNSMKLSLTATGSSREVTASNNGTPVRHEFMIPATPGTNYTLTYWMRTNYVSGASATGASAAIYEYTGSNSFATGTFGTFVQTTTGWTQYKVSATIGAGTRFITPAMRVRGNDGTATLIMDAWFDDLVLTPTVNTTRSAAV